MLIKENENIHQRLEIEREHLKQSIHLYQLAVSHKLDNEIDAAHKRALSRQRAFQRVYNKMQHVHGLY